MPKALTSTSVRPTVALLWHCNGTASAGQAAVGGTGAVAVQSICPDVLFRVIVGLGLLTLAGPSTCATVPHCHDGEADSGLG